MSKNKKIKIPKSVLELRLSPKKYAKKHNIRIAGKGMSKGQKKRNIKRLKNAYAELAINGLNKAVRILADNNPDSKKILKVKDGIDNIITNSSVMKKIAKLYKKNPKSYPNMIYLPNMIMSTLEYYNQDKLPEDEKKIADSIDTEGLVEFCESILKKEIKRYKKLGVNENVSYQLATIIPTTKVLKNNNRIWYKKFIQSLYPIAAEYEIDIDLIFKAVMKLDKKKTIKRKDFDEGFFSEFILTKSSNKSHSFNDTQKELHESLIEKTLEYLNTVKKSHCRDIIKNYIKRRKTAESYKNDTKRVIKFIDHANSNSSYANLKAVIQELIAENSSNELYLS